MGKTQLMTQTLGNTSLKGQNRTPDFNPNFRGCTVTFWPEVLLDNLRYGSHVSSQPRITRFGGLMAKLWPDKEKGSGKKNGQHLQTIRTLTNLSHQTPPLRIQNKSTTQKTQNRISRSQTLTKLQTLNQNIPIDGGS